MTPFAVMRMRSVPAAPSGPTTWDPAAKSSNIVLSSGNMIAGAATSPAGVRATNAHSTGVYQFEVNVLARGLTSITIGVKPSSESLDSGPGLVAGGNGIGLRGNGVITVGAVSGATLSGFATGDVVGIVADFGAQVLTAYKNGALLGTLASGSVFAAAGPMFPSCGTGSSTNWSMQLVVVGLAFPVAGATPWG